MQVLAFDTAVVPIDTRLGAFRTGSYQFEVDALGDPSAFASRWRMLTLGDVNLIHAHVTPVRYRREPATIRADGEDRITIHYYLAGGEVGEIDGRPVDIRPGEAAIWDLARPVDVSSPGPNELIIITLPRHMIDEVLPAPSVAGLLAPSPELTLAIDQARYLIEHAEAVPEAAAVFLSRALRDMFAVAMIPAYRSLRPMAAPDAPLLQRMTDLIDARLSSEPSVEDVAIALEAPPSAVAGVADHFGGLALLTEQRRLLAAYRLLCDPGETSTVESIAHRCGFNSLTLFSRRFRHVFRTSPSGLRRYGRGHLPRWAGAYHVDQHYKALIAR